MNQFISNRISNLVQSDIRAMTFHCNEMGGINMGQGLCKLPIPDEIIKGAQDALTVTTKNIYSAPEGITELRFEIAKKLKKENNIIADPDSEILVTAGATGGFASCALALLNPGDSILLFEPYYGYHLNSALLAGLDVKYAPMQSGSVEFTERFFDSYFKNIQAVVVCTPSNPSGKMWSMKEIDALANSAVKNNVLVITDEMYEYFRFGKEHISPASNSKLEDRCISLMGLSKTFSITGWRLGYLSGPEKLVQKIRIANDLFYVCAPSPLQYGVAAGFNIDSSYFLSMQIDFKKKRDQLCSALETGGFVPIVPEGAYYVLANIENFGFDNSYDFALELLKKVNVAGIPGRAFFSGPEGEKYIRFNFALLSDQLDIACKSLETTKKVIHG